MYTAAPGGGGDSGRKFEGFGFRIQDLVRV